MGKLYSLLAFGLLLVNSATGQGTFQFTWHGDSNFFEATFRVYDYELASGANFSSELFLDSMSVTNPAGQTYHGGDSSSFGSGSYIPWGLNFHLNDFQRSTELVIQGGGLSGSTHRTAGLMWEQPMSGPPFLWYESGYWSIAQIPEPCVTAILATGTLLWFRKRCASRRRKC